MDIILLGDVYSAGMVTAFLEDCFQGRLPTMTQKKVRDWTILVSPSRLDPPSLHQTRSDATDVFNTILYL